MAQPFSFRYRLHLVGLTALLALSFLMACNTSKKKGKAQVNAEDDSVQLVQDDLFFSFRRKEQQKRRELIDSLEKRQNPKSTEDEKVIAGDQLPQLDVQLENLGAVPDLARLVGMDTQTGFLQLIQPADSALTFSWLDPVRKRVIPYPQARQPDCLELDEDKRANLPSGYYRFSDTLQAYTCGASRDETVHLNWKGRSWTYDGFELLHLRVPHALLRLNGEMLLANLNTNHLSHLIFSGSGMLLAQADSFLVCDYGYDYEAKQFLTEAFMISVRDRGFRSLFTFRHPAFTLRPFGQDAKRGRLYFRDEVNSAGNNTILLYDVATGSLRQLLQGQLIDPVIDPTGQFIYVVTPSAESLNLQRIRVPEVLPAATSSPSDRRPPAH
jgi:hypothetical protein